MTITSEIQNRLIPSGFHENLFLSTHIAWDICDLFVETLNGKNTLHDTVGIAYQFNRATAFPLDICESSFSEQSNINVSNSNYDLPPSKKKNNV